MEYSRILLVDDDCELTAVLDRWLTKKGDTVTSVLDPEQALEATCHRNYDVAVLDRSFPNIEGFQLMQLLIGRMPNLQVIFLTGRGGDQDREDACSCGAFAYLMKPCSLDEVQSVIEQALQFCKAARATRDLPA